MWTQRLVQSADGTTLRAYAAGVARATTVRGGVPADGSAKPGVVVCPGLAGGHHAFTPQVRYLGDRLRFVSWDFRGLHPIRPEEAAAAGGPCAAVGREIDCSIDRQVDDLFAVAAAEGLDRPAVVGWSMGAQVALEAYRRRPDAVRCLVLMSSTGRRPFESLTRGSASARAMTGLLALARRGERRTAAALEHVLRRGDVARWVARVGLVAASADPLAFRELVAHARDLDAAAYLRTALCAAEHDASDMLASVRVPTLVISGEHDPFTPPALAQQLARSLPLSEILIVPRGRHYPTLEHPELLSLHLERFFCEVGLLR
ncbi:MAG: alpha/beta hydrolase [Polyangiaceae bacterium]|nr:alpha/beta hydrolase [Polyangiaceae bacterium]